MNRKLVGVSFFCLGILIYQACSSEDRQTCEPGRQLECDCPGGVKGVQVCLNDGSGWGECDCPCDKDCTGRDCGPDPECGESCGTCGTNQTCSADGKCECDFESCGDTCCAQGQVCANNSCCTPDCGVRECGLDPVCNSSCGECLPDEDCNIDGQCVPSVPGPRLCADPTSLNFGTIQVGGSLEMSFNLENCGDADLNLIGASFAQDSSPDFDLLNLPAFPQTLAPGASVDIEVRYTPQSADEDEGGVEIFSDDIASDPVTHLTGTVALSGSGVGNACEIQPTPFVVNFGGVVIGQSDTINLLVSNHGVDPCTFYDAQITRNSADAEFSIVSKPAAGININPGDDVLVQVKYAPVNLGVDGGVLTLSTSDPEGDISIDLNGQGVVQAVCALEVTPEIRQFGTIQLGSSVVSPITLTNTGDADCHISDLELRAGIGPAEFDFQNPPTLPLTISRQGYAGSTYVLDVEFAPTQTGMHDAYVWITSDDPDIHQSGGVGCDSPPQPGQTCVPLRGWSEELVIEIIPSELDFGLVAVGCNSSERRVALYKLCNFDLNVTSIALDNTNDTNFEITYAPSLPYPLPLWGFEVRLRYNPQDTSLHSNNIQIHTDNSIVDLITVPIYGQGTNISDQTDVFFQQTNVKTDVLFVIDNSGNMGWAQDEMSGGIPYFISQAIALDADFHIGVIATEVNEAETGMGNPPRDIIPGVLVQAPGHPKIITPTTPDLEQALSDNARLGECCSDEQEAGLQAAWMALSQPLVDDPAANAGFLRDDAKLYIICLSNEQDQSKGDPRFYENFFEFLKGSTNTEWMKLSAICGDSPSGCSASGGDAEYGSRYIRVANETGGIFESICTTNWQLTMENMAADAFSAVREFPLSRSADPVTISVTVDGSPVPQASCDGCPNGWTYYPDTNLVYFGDDVVPAPGSRVEVMYTALCL